MRQDSETNIIVLNTALKYKIQRNTHTKTQIYQISNIWKKIRRKNCWRVDTRRKYRLMNREAAVRDRARTDREEWSVAYGSDKDIKSCRIVSCRASERQNNAALTNTLAPRQRRRTTGTGWLPSTQRPVDPQPRHRVCDLHAECRST